ncbi:MAG: CheR family methyltransferase [Candidatus Krumholzibacteriia bacterium]
MAFTFFFRDQAVLDQIRVHAAPTFSGRRHIDVWDAGCAHGPEAYSLAITLRESMGPFMFRNVRITASDVDANFAGQVTSGCYPYDQIQRVPDELRARYFQPLPETPGLWRLREDLRQAVTFVHHDLLTLHPPREGLCLIVCKNVLLHFSEAERTAVVAMFHRALADGGFLVTEQTQTLPAPLAPGFVAVSPNARIWRKVSAAAAAPA